MAAVEARVFYFLPRLAPVREVLASAGRDSVPRALLRILVTCHSTREIPNPETAGEFARIPWGGSIHSACGGRRGSRDSVAPGYWVSAAQSLESYRLQTRGRSSPMPSRSAALERPGWPGLREPGWGLCERGLKQFPDMVTVKIPEPGHSVSL